MNNIMVGKGTFSVAIIVDAIDLRDKYFKS